MLLGLQKSLFRYMPFKSFPLQRHNAENLKQIFPKKELCGLSPIFHIHVFASDLYCIFPGSVCLFCCGKTCGPILGIYKLPTDI